MLLNFEKYFFYYSKKITPKYKRNTHVSSNQLQIFRYEYNFDFSLGIILT